MHNVMRFQFLKGSCNKSNNTIIVLNSWGTNRSFNNQAEKQTQQSKAVCNYTIEEIKIPVPSLGGHLAGKLWQGSKASRENSSSPPIICLHGSQDNCGTFDPLIPLILKDDMKVFAFDLPGHGLSYRTKELYYDFFLDGLASIKRTLQYFKWDKATLLGHSLGSSISYIYSGSFPEEVHKYIAMDNLRPIPEEDVKLYFQNTLKSLLHVEQKLTAGTKKRPVYSYEQMLQRTYLARKKTVTLEGCKALLIRGSEKVNGTDGYRFTHDLKTNTTTSYKRLDDYQTQMIAKGIKCPVCVIKGEPGEDYEPREDFLRIVDLLIEHNGQVEFHLVPGTHHFHLNDPHLVAPIIKKFIED